MPVTAAALHAADADRATAGDRIDQITRDMTAAWATTGASSQAQLGTVLTGLLAAGRWPSRRTITTSIRLRVTLTVIQHGYVRLAARAATLIGQAARDVAQASAAAQGHIIGAQLPPGVTLAAGLAEVTGEQLDQIANRAATRAAATLGDLPARLIDAIRGEIIRGGRGGDPDHAVARVLAAVGDHSAATLARLLLVARTEIMDAHRAAAQAAHDAASTILAGWRWWSQLSTDTCPSCWAMHGTLHPLSEPGPLDHPAGRCRRIPVLRPWAELGLPGTEPADAFPDAEEEFAGLPVADQLRIMGPGRLHLLDTGQITWSDLARRRSNPGWRPCYVATPLRDLT